MVCDGAKVTLTLRQVREIPYSNQTGSQSYLWNVDGAIAGVLV